MNALAMTDQEQRIAARIDPSMTKTLAISDSAGGLAFANMAEVIEAAKMMALASVAVPKHLRGNPGACFAICVQAIEWRMSPFAVANKSYSVNDRLAYEAQLIHAVILQRAPIKGRVKFEFSGEGDNRTCRVWAALRDDPDERPEYTSPLFGKITPKNSPLWKSDPDHQLGYYAVRAWCRRHFPDVLLGVYAADEIEDAPRIERPAAPRPTLNARLDELARPKPTIDRDREAEFLEQALAGEESQAPPEDERTVEQPSAQVDDGPRAQLLDWLRHIAINDGPKRLTFALAKLTEQDQALLTAEDYAALRAAASPAAESEP